MYQSRHLANTRIDVADALRGIAVAGIILYHSVEHFNIFTQEPISIRWRPTRWWLMYWLGCCLARCTASLLCFSV